MKKWLQRILSIFLVALLLCAAGTPGIQAAAPDCMQPEPAGNIWLEPLRSLHWPSSADDCGKMLKRVFYDYFDLAVDALLNAVLRLLPDIGWPDQEDYQTANFYEGDSTFLDQPAQGARWHLGYAKASLLTGNETDGKHYHAGGFSFPAKPVTKVIDDQAVRVACLSDGSGRGTKVFVSLDGYGVSLTDVRTIRARLADFAAANGINAISVSAVHQHSCIDTLGLGGDLLKMLVGNAAITKYHLNFPISNGKNPDFMENLCSVTAETIRQAVASMAPGSLYASTADVSAYMRDKRAPEVFDPNLTRLRFVPDGGGRETWIVNGAIHPVSFGTGSTEISSDFPYYMEQTVNREANANLIFFQGAELGITTQRELTDQEGMTSLESAQAFGTRLGEILCGIGPQAEQEVAPLLNLRMREISIPVDNQILVLAAKAQAVNNIAVKTADGVEIVTEIGYLELGNRLCAVMVPGEIAPELIYGGCLPAELAWRHEDWPLPPLEDSVPERHMLVLGLTNDQAGYILPDNDVRCIIANVNEEVVSPGGRAGSTVVNGLHALIESVK